MQKYLESRFGVQYAVVSHHSYLHAVDRGEARDDGGRVELLELVEPTAVTYAGDDLQIGHTVVHV